jgi:hypothetical protein
MLKVKRKKLLVISFLLLISSIQTIGQDLNSNPCISSNPELGDSAFWANSSIELFAQKKYEDAIQLVDACFSQWAPAAVELQKTLHKKNNKLPPFGAVTRQEKEKIHQNYLINDVSIALWVKAVSLEALGKIEYSKNIYSYCIFLTHGRAWDPQGWFWKPSDDCANRGRKLL